MNNFSTLVIPLFVVIIVLYGLIKEINIYESFLVGAKEGLVMSFDIFPSIIGMLFAINIFLDSNFLFSFTSIFENFLNILKVPIEILPMALLRPISGTATLTLMNEIFLKYGPDSFLGFLSSIVQGCTDTTFYVLLLYFGSVKITKTKYALKVGLFADFMGLVFAIIVTNIFF